jgi:L-aspartate oxidase
VLARDAGAALADLELLQFHPTALVADGPQDGFLITEAVRGEDAILLTSVGEQFVDELAPRDEVARAVHRELERSGAKAVLLDMRGIDPDGFPNVVAALRDAGLDPRRDLVPVAPAAHYAIGGIATDGAGRTTLPGLYAVGECACTGIHGANRLASNSLSECFVLGRRAALASRTEPAASTREQPLMPARPPRPGESTRAALWRHAGIVRSRDGLVQLLSDEDPLARLIARCALAREESRGCHVRSDFPDPDPSLDGRHLVLDAGTEEPHMESWQGASQEPLIQP